MNVFRTKKLSQTKVARVYISIKLVLVPLQEVLTVCGTTPEATVGANSALEIKRSAPKAQFCCAQDLESVGKRKTRATRQRLHFSAKQIVDKTGSSTAQLPHIVGSRPVFYTSLLHT